MVSYLSHPGISRERLSIAFKARYFSIFVDHLLTLKLDYFDLYNGGFHASINKYFAIPAVLDINLTHHLAD